VHTKIKLSFLHEILASAEKSFSKYFEPNAEFNTSTPQGRQRKGNLGTASVANLQDGYGCGAKRSGLYHQA
jgi:hypothetical protein